MTVIPLKQCLTSLPKWKFKLAMRRKEDPVWGSKCLTVSVLSSLPWSSQPLGLTELAWGSREREREVGHLSSPHQREQWQQAQTLPLWRSCAHSSAPPWAEWCLCVCIYVHVQECTGMSVLQYIYIANKQYQTGVSWVNMEVGWEFPKSLNLSFMHAHLHHLSLSTLGTCVSN